MITRVHGETLKYRGGWINPINILALQQVVKERNKTWTLDDGRVFVVTYVGKRFNSICMTDKDCESIYVVPKDERFVAPSGYISIRQLMTWFDSN